LVATKWQASKPATCGFAFDIWTTSAAQASCRNVSVSLYDRTHGCAAVAAHCMSDAGAVQRKSVVLRSHSLTRGRVAAETDCVCGNLMVTTCGSVSCDKNPEVIMPQKIKNDSDVESLIELLYLISDALHIAEDCSGKGFESTLEICEMLSNAHLRTTALLARAGGKQSCFLNGSIVGGSAQRKKLVFVCN
jgi:hypothetical protein